MPALLMLLGKRQISTLLDDVFERRHQLMQKLANTSQLFNILHARAERTVQVDRF
jgi:hypothetical protein